MKGIKNRIMNAVGRAMYSLMKRSFYGASATRLVSRWFGTTNTADFDIKMGLSKLRARARDAEQNNDYMKRYLHLVAANIIGPEGIQFKARVYDRPGKMDTVANELIEWGYWEWGRNCMYGGGTMVELERIVIKAVARDGEVLIRKIRGASAGNKFNFALQILEADHLDEQYTEKNIHMGIEYNADDTIKGYWIWQRHPGAEPGHTGNNNRIFVPKADMYHLYLKERPSQTRGFPWAHSTLKRLKDIEGFEEAAIVAARVAASQMGFITTPDGTIQGDPNSKDTDGSPIISAEPGTFQVLNPGQSMEMFNPTHPSGLFDPFLKSQLRGASSGLNVSYAALSGDLSDANYSSLRTGALTEQDNWKLLQSWLIDGFMVPMFSDWLDMALLTGMVKLPYQKYDKYNSPEFFPRRWPWVDPVKDQNAEILAITNRTMSRTRALANRGIDIEDLLDEIVEEERMMKERGIITEEA